MLLPAWKKRLFQLRIPSDYILKITDPNNMPSGIDRIEYAFLERNRAKKNTLVAHTGLSSEGKSTISLNIVDKILAKQGYDLAKYLDDIVIYTPFEYPKKIDKHFEDKELKDIPFAIIDDARFVVSSKNWRSFLNQAITEVLSVSRVKKPMTMIFNTQFLKDLDKDIRLLINYWGECKRPLHSKPYVKYISFYHDTSDPMNIKIKKARFKGILEYPDGRRVKEIPSAFHFSKVRPEVWHAYETASFNAKGKLIRKKLDALIEAMKKEHGLGDRVASLVDWYKKPEHWQELMLFFEYKRRKVSLKKEAYEVLGLTRQEALDFKEQIQDYIKSVFEQKKKMLTDVVMSETDADKLAKLTEQETKGDDVNE